MLHVNCIVHVLGSTPGPPTHDTRDTRLSHAGIFIMDPVVRANLLLLFSEENLAKGRAEGDLQHKKHLADAAQTKADLKGKPEDDDRSDDSQRTIPYEPEDHSDDSQRTIPYKPEAGEHPDAAEQPACVPVPVQRSFKRLLTDQDMKDECSRFNKEMRKKRKPCIGK
jgi:hypothetical protein